ncbi:hypothetical protein KUW09_17290 [Mameliella alba]|nr:hypothetical protein [Antarctobacter heliothermus]MBY6145812.1 hypothetical protein [Mameliella alba]MBY6161134.1 hypothetical protein [Mameliella alba]MBY6169604.1 hypothetical protein [Mameliella alba]MBY6174623.1 hypothetical protein [Mameliella alba]
MLRHILRLPHRSAPHIRQCDLPATLLRDVGLADCSGCRSPRADPFQTIARMRP